MRSEAKALFVHNSLPDRAEAAAYRGVQASCAMTVRVGGCGNGHKFAKVIKCGKEFCPDCGRNGSDVHERRIYRWKGKVDAMQSVGYYVVTIPEDVRMNFFDAALCKAFERACIRYLKRTGVTRGLVRWHWLGDCPTCDGDGCKSCKGTGMARKFNPHINILIDGGYKKEKEIRAFREFCRKWLKNNAGYHGKKYVLHYSYKTTEGQRNHVLRYVTRATLRHADLWGLRKLTYKFRASGTFGKFEKVIPEGYEIQAGVCPCCLSETGELARVKYGDKLTVKELNWNGSERLGAGYFRLHRVHKKPKTRPPDYTPDQLYDLNRLKIAYVIFEMYGEKGLRAAVDGWLQIDFDGLTLRDESTNGPKQTSLFS